MTLARQPNALPLECTHPVSTREHDGHGGGKARSVAEYAAQRQ